MKYPYESEVIEMLGPDWRLILMEAWHEEPWHVRVYYTLTRRHLWRVVRGVEEA